MNILYLKPESVKYNHAKALKVEWNPCSTIFVSTCCGDFMHNMQEKKCWDTDFFTDTFDSEDML